MFLYLPFQSISSIPLQVSVADGTHLVLFLPREAVTKDTSTCTERQKGVVHFSSSLHVSLTQSQGIYFQIQDLSFSKSTYNFSALHYEEKANVHLAFLKKQK